MRRVCLTTLLGVLLLGGCISPCTKMDQHDLHWYAEDRYRVADAMPARDKDEAFNKIEAYWESIEAIRHVKDENETLNIGGDPMTRDEAHRHVRERIHRTEEIAGITLCDYCGRATLWTAWIPARIVKTPFDALAIFLESPVTNIER